MLGETLNVVEETPAEILGEMLGDTMLPEIIADEPEGLPDSLGMMLDTLA